MALLKVDFKVIGPIVDTRTSTDKAEFVQELKWPPHRTCGVMPI